MIGVVLGMLFVFLWVVVVIDSIVENVKKISVIVVIVKVEDSKINDIIIVVGVQEIFCVGGNDLILIYLDGQVVNGGCIGFFGQ